MGEWGFLLSLPAVVAFASSGLPGWMRMWALALSLACGMKCLGFRDAWRAGLRPSFPRLLGYAIAWPGMDSRTFLGERGARRPGRPGEWLRALEAIALGTVLVWLVTPAIVRAHPGIGAWTAMVGIVLVLHFGAFHLLSLAWRVAGTDAPPIMLAPLRSVSVAELWGSRWNRAFSDWARRYLFAGPARRWGVAPAALLVFLASGLAHELVISVPARGGLGLPTAYFAVQGVATLIERTPAARRLGLGRGWRGRLFTAAVVAGPVYCLFHPPFVRNVVLPMLRAIGAA